MKQKVFAIITCLILATTAFAAIGASQSPDQTTARQTPSLPRLTTIYVDDDNTEGPWDGTMTYPYQHIQDGVNAATTGDTIYVFNGLYTEAVEIATSITLTGESMEGVIVDGGGTLNAIHIIADSVCITSISIQNGVYGIHAENAASTAFTGCHVSLVSYGIGLDFSSTATIEDSQFHDIIGSGIITSNSPSFICTGCTFENMQTGVYLQYSSDITIQDCTMLNMILINQYNGGSAIALDNCGPGTIDSILADNCTDYGIFLFFSPGFSITNCTFVNCHWNPDAQFPSYYHSVGIEIVVSPTTIISNCSIHDNDNGIYIAGGSPDVTIHTTTFANNQEGSLDIYASSLEEYILDIDSTNTINGIPILYLTDEQDLFFDSSTEISYAAFINCTNITITDTTLQGLLMAYATNSSIINVTSHHSKTGFKIVSSSGCSVVDSNAYNTTNGFSGDPANLINCKAYNNNVGFSLTVEGKKKDNLKAGEGGNVTDCLAYDNTLGFYEAKGSYMTGCQAYNNRETGFTLYCDDPFYGAVLRDNLFYNNTYNFNTEGWSGPYGYEVHDLDASNLVDGKPILYITGQDDTVYDGAVTAIGTAVFAGCNNITLQNAQLSRNNQGVLFMGTTYSHIINCTMTNNRNGIWLYSTSFRNTITDTQCLFNEKGISAQEGSSFTIIDHCILNNNSQFGYWSQVTQSNTIRNCIVNGNGYSYSEDEQEYPGSLQYGGPGIMIHFATPDNIIENCTVNNNYEGIYNFWDNNNLTVRDCTMNNNTLNGLHLRYPTQCTITDCTASGNTYGFGLDEEANNNKFTNCTAYNNDYGMYITYRTYGNDIYHNNFYNNTMNAYDSCSNNWDNGAEGNYWGDYEGVDADGDGIGDTPYNIPGGNNKDNYPFMAPNGWQQPDDTQPPVVEITKPQKALYFNDKRICGFPTPIIIKGITITVNATDNESGIDHVSIYIDDILQTNLTSQPYTWKWDTRTPLHFRHQIKIVAYDQAGLSSETTQSVRKFL